MFLALLGAAMAGPAAAAGNLSKQDQVEVRLVAAQTAVGSADTVRLGLHFILKPGWKTYWRSPGDAGYPVTVDWAGSENLGQATLLWPVPHRFTLFGLDTFGYENEVVLPVMARLARAGQPLSLKAHLRYLVCEEICIPYEADLALDLPAGEAAPSPDAQLIDRYVAQVPGDGSRQGLTLEQVSLAGSEEAPALEATARASLMPFESPDLVVEGPAGLSFGKPDVALSNGGRLARFSLPITAGPGAPPLANTAVTLTLADGIRGLERTVTLTPASGGGGGFAAMLAIALLGGLILNLMPCVLPVLSLKLLGVAGHGGGERAHVRLSFLVSAAGVLTAFLLLAGTLVVLKAAGLAIGWGIQFQQPLFLAAMALIVTLFAANLMGWFEITLPGWLSGLAASEGRHIGAGDRRSLPGYFLTGMLATLLATPCSAPFVGTAVGFALARGPAEILAIFSAMGAGLAAPYLAIAAAPGLAVALPRPGRWMIGLRRVLSLALGGTALWLLSIVAGELGYWGTALLAALLIAVAATLAWLHRLPERRRPALWAGVAALALAVLLLPVAMPGRPSAEARSEAQVGDWVPFDEARIASLVAEGRTVFVDVTADWCITCLANKTLVLDTAEVQDQFAQRNIVAMRADWTRPDDSIARYLARYGRYGVPFNAVYGPKAPEGIVLPELLSRDAVLDGLVRAGN
ncbi:MAG: protein-disulfide reductase DsbD family protein [Pseudomonadota bacterium]